MWGANWGNKFTSGVLRGFCGNISLCYPKIIIIIIISLIVKRIFHLSFSEDRLSQISVHNLTPKRAKCLCITCGKVFYCPYKPVRDNGSLTEKKTVSEKYRIYPKKKNAQKYHWVSTNWTQFKHIDHILYNSSNSTYVKYKKRFKALKQNPISSQKATWCKWD